MSRRTDAHRPSVLTPTDYEYVAVEAVKGDGLDAILFLQDQRRYLRSHMERTSGWYSGHEHGGVCMVCGSVNAIYTVIFYHQQTNTYVRMGAECARQVDAGGWGGDMNRLRRAVADARARKAGKQKAAALLDDAGLGGVVGMVEDYKQTMSEWRHEEIGWNHRHSEFLDSVEGLYGLAGDIKGLRAADAEWKRDNPAPDYPFVRAAMQPLEIMADIYDRLVQYGSVSEKQVAFLRRLVEQVRRAEEVQAQRDAEAAAAPAWQAGRQGVEGAVLSVREQEGYDGGFTFKMLVKLDDGRKLWCTAPAALLREVRNADDLRGARVAFTATVQPKQGEESFAFGSRPAAARLVAQAAA